MQESDRNTKKQYDNDEEDSDSNYDFVDMPFLEKFNKLLFQRPGSRALSVPSYFPLATMSQYVSSNLLAKSNNPEQNNAINTSNKKRIETSKTNAKYVYYIITVKDSVICLWF